MDNFRLHGIDEPCDIVHREDGDHDGDHEHDEVDELALIIGGPVLLRLERHPDVDIHEVLGEGDDGGDDEDPEFHPAGGEECRGDC